MRTYLNFPFTKFDPDFHGAICAQLAGTFGDYTIGSTIGRYGVDASPHDPGLLSIARFYGHMQGLHHVTIDSDGISCTIPVNYFASSPNV